MFTSLPGAYRANTLVLPAEVWSCRVTIDIGSLVRRFDTTARCRAVWTVAIRNRNLENFVREFHTNGL